MFLRYREVFFNPETNGYGMVKDLKNNTVNEVKIGNFVQIYRIDGQIQYCYVTVNGEAVEDLSSRSIYVKVEGRTTIEAEVYSPTYTFTEDDCRNEFLLFKGVFKADADEKVYVLRGSTAWMVEPDGTINESATSAAGNVVFSMGDGSYSREFTGIAGETVNLNIAVTDADIAARYEVAGFCLMDGFPNSTISNPYVINPEDANAEGVIWICGLMQLKPDAVDSIAAGEGLRYDAATRTIYSESGVKVFDINGSLLIDSAADETSVDSFAKGLYIAVAGSSTIKFVK